MNEFDNLNTQILKKPLSFAALVDSGTYFEVDFDNDLKGNYYSDDDYSDAENDIDHESLMSPWTHSFEELRQLMTPINGHIHKRITTTGDKEKGLVPDKARVALRYSAYWEGEGAPFDSSLLRGTKFEFETGQNAVLEGLEAAVRTMYPFERAEFIISYHLLYHEMGCPPRIKPKADALFKIEILGYSLIGDQESLENITEEDRGKFAIVFPKAQDMHLHGKDCVKRGKIRQAIPAFEKAISSLNYCRLADECDEQKQTELLITLYTNLMICYNKIDKPSKACICMKGLRHVTHNNPSCKALFQEGRALAALGDYERARQAFVKAQAKQPKNKEISDEIIKMEERVTKYNNSVSDMWSRAFSGKDKPQSEPKDEREECFSQQFKEDFQFQLSEFEKSPLQSISMSRQMYTDQEFDVLRLLAAKQNMKLAMSPLDVTQLKLSKLEIK